jgi:parallel beta-helix repeat protein
MSVTAQTAKTGPYVMAAFPQACPTGFAFQQSSDLIVIDATLGVLLTLGSDYTVTGGGYIPSNQMQTGTVTILSGGAHSVLVGDVIWILRNVPLNQIASATSATLSPVLLEEALDKAATIDQQLLEKSTRALSFEAFETLSATLVLAQRKGNLLGFDATTGAVTYVASTAIAPAYQTTANPRQFGAKGDGVTDDTGAFQAAMNSLTSGGDLVITPASAYYKITSSISGLSNVNIVGCGSGGKIQSGDANAGTDISLFTFVNKSNVSVRNCYMSGTAKNISVGDGSGACVYFIGCTDISVRDNRFEAYTRSACAFNTCNSVIVRGNYCATGGVNASTLDIATFTPDGNTSSDILIDGNTCISPNSSGIGIEHLNTGVTTYVRIVNNRVFNKNRHGIYLYGGTVSNSVVSNNTVQNVGWIGIYNVVTGVGNVIANNVVVNAAQNVSAGLPWAGIGLGVGPYNGYSICGNTINGTKGFPGIRCDTLKFSVISNNTITGDGTASAGGAFGAAAISLNDAEDCTVASNVVKYSGTEGAGVSIQPTDGVTVYKRNIVSGNKFYRPSSFAVYLFHTALSAIVDNVIDQAGNFGLYCDYATDTRISGNICSAGTAGTADIELDDTCTRVTVESNKLFGTKATGNGIKLNGVGCTDCTVQQNDLSGLTALAVNSLLSDSGTRTQVLGNKLGATSMTGTFTLGAAATLVVSNANVVSTSKIALTPTNASAATLQGSAKCLYVSSISAGVSFTVATASAAAAAGTETFLYTVS